MESLFYSLLNVMNVQYINVSTSYVSTTNNLSSVHKTGAYISSVMFSKKRITVSSFLTFQPGTETTTNTTYTLLNNAHANHAYYCSVSRLCKGVLENHILKITRFRPKLTNRLFYRLIFDREINIYLTT